MTGPDSIAARRAELERRLAALSPADRERLSAAAPPPAAAPTIPPRDPAAGIPLSFAQELLWRLERVTPGHAYNVPRAVRLGGALDIAALQCALDALVARHEALRTTFKLVRDEPRQVVNAPVPVVLTRIDVSDGPEGERDAAARRHMKELARVPFDLEKDLQLRAALIRLADDDHILQLVSHHVATDGWSGNILVRELAALYDGFRAGAPITLPALSVQFADYAAWQRSVLTGEHLERLLAWWRGQLAGAPPTIDLPTDRARPAAAGFDGAVRGTTLPPSVVDGMRALTRSAGVTNFMVLLSALYVLLSRYAGEEELVVGTPIAGRPHPELEGVAGFFTNTLLLRGSVAGNPTFRELLERVRTTALGAFDHQEIPLETLLLATGPGGRPLATMPQVVLSTEDPDRERFRLAGTTSTPVAAARGATKFDLSVWAAERPDGLRVAAEFRTDLFDDATIDRLLRHFGVLLAGAVAAPDTPVADIPIIDDDERRRALYEWNDTKAGYPEQATIHGLIEAQARRRPDAIAVECTVDGVRTTLTYRELDRRANRVAQSLVTAGVAPDERVALCLDRSVMTAVAILGVLKAGGAYLPIDPAYPDDRIEFTVQDAGARLMLTDAANRPRLAPLPLATRLLDIGDAVLGALTDDAPPVVVSPRNLAYVIYTSGSTGRPKGCMIEHRNVTRLIVNDRSVFDFNENDVWTVFHSFAFDFSVWELFGALILGGRAVIVPRAVALDPREFMALLVASGTTILNQVPSAFQGLMEEVVLRRPALKVRYVIFGGEALQPALLRKWRAFRPQARLINMFGITETTVHVTYKEIGDAEIAAGVSNVGRPIPTTTLYVLDAARRPVPVGVAGELCVGGLGVARGYLNRPELNAARFVPDPFATDADAGALLYRSGDLGRQLPNGEVEYIGRRDHQVKVRGHRIELGEIEAVLLTQPGVAAAVVIVREDAPGDQRIVAYVVAESGAEPSVSVLRDGLRERLPDVMIPSAFAFLERLPLTANGKVNTGALPAPRTTGDGTTASGYAMPHTAVEHELTEIWEGLFPGKRIGIRDDFFELGGHSLLAIRLLGQIETIRNQRLPMATLFESSTIEKLGRVISNGVHAEGEPPHVLLNPEATGPAFAFVHGDAHGAGWYMRRVAQAAPNNRIIVLPTVRPGPGAPETIQEMATMQIANLKAVQPEGPYQLGGYCTGGLVALEMAQQLRAAGEVTRLLVVVDTTPGNVVFRPFTRMLAVIDALTPADRRLDTRAGLLRTLRYWYSRWTKERRKSAAEQFIWMRRVLKRTTEELQSGKRVSVMLAGRKPGTPDDVVLDDSNVMQGATSTDAGYATLKHATRASFAYIHDYYPGRVVCVVAVPALNRDVPDRSYGWKRIAPDVEAHEIHATHIGLITREVEQFAAKLAEILEREAGHG